MNMVIPVAYVSCMVLQGGEATATRTCPLWSDNKAIHEEALAKAAEEAREKLKEENVTLDIDPLKGIAKPAAKQTKEEVKEGLFKKWYNMKAEVRFHKIIVFKMLHNLGRSGESAP